MDESEGGAAPAESGPEAAPAAGECTTCLTARAIVLAVAFAMFAAYCAADFATGGRVTAAVAGQLAALRGRAGGEGG